MARDGGKCRYCRKRATSLDHVMPKSRGGRGSFDNLVAACIPCNTAKANRTPHEAQMKLLPPVRSLPHRFRDARTQADVKIPRGLSVPSIIHPGDLPVFIGHFKVVHVVDHKHSPPNGSPYA